MHQYTTVQALYFQKDLVLGQSVKDQLLYAKQFHCMKMTNDLVMLLQSVRGEKIT